MKKAAKKVKKGLKVFVSRFGHDPVTVSVENGATVEEVLDEASVELTGREEVFILGERADMDDEVDDKDVLSVVTPKQAGACAEGDDEDAPDIQ